MKSEKQQQEIDEDDLGPILILSSIPIRELDSNKNPIGWGSGCIVDYKGERFILTVSHVTENQGNWSIEVKADYGKGVELHQIGSMTYIKKGNIFTGDVEDVDFAFAKIPKDIQPFYQEFDEHGKKVVEIPRTLIDLNFDSKIVVNNKFGFAGTTRFKSFENDIYSEQRLVTNMSFVEEEDNMYVFKLPSKNPGDKYFRATSGAPIIDNYGNVVALVCSGVEEKDLIYGININKYKPLLQAYLKSSS